MKSLKTGNRVKKKTTIENLLLTNFDSS